ncbi:unnamed protein product [Porites evermanni]|uniref:Uncharacterized protein n=1 Tax=Porites evermanni TaxID=104178 RepID=A0ABN8MG46_9CNID|nr:unnamed protein product [Porites evermanni]
MSNAGKLRGKSFGISKRLFSHGSEHSRSVMILVKENFDCELKLRLDEFEIDADSDIIIGGDFKVILDCDRDGFGGKAKLKIACKKIENLCSSFDLIDIWRIRNPESKRFTWKQSNPLIQRRLDFWLTSGNL